jgi:hypothetical protein
MRAAKLQSVKNEVSRSPGDLRKLTILATVLLFGVSIATILSPASIARGDEATSTQTSTSTVSNICGFLTASQSISASTTTTTTSYYTPPATMTVTSGTVVCVIVIPATNRLSPLQISLEIVSIIALVVLTIIAYKTDKTYRKYRRPSKPPTS